MSLDALVNEAKQELEPRVTDDAWAKMEAQLVARVTEERAARVDEVNVVSLPARRRARLFQLGAAAVAIAASIAFFVASDARPTSHPDGADGHAQIQADPAAGALRSTEGAGEVRVDGVAATAGHPVRAGNLVEAQGARAVLERPRKVEWLLEGNASDGANAAGNARARVKSAGESLVLALEDGAVEAQVTPVPSGEAFAVDIATDTSLVRIAVHGTHLRVARAGSHVTLDLSEGIVSIGTPPRTGSTYGTLVTAPAHVEFDATDLSGTLKVDHAAGSVRTALPLAPSDAPSLARNDGLTGNAGAGNARELGASQPTPPSTQPGAVAVATVPRPVPSPAPARDLARPGAAKPNAARPGLPPRDAIAQAVRECGVSSNHVGDVRVTVTSSLKLRIGASGDVEVAQFDPPLQPEVQTCAANAIYKAKMEDAAGGTVIIPIAFSY